MGSKSFIPGRERGKKTNSVTLVKQKYQVYSVQNEAAFSETFEVNKSSSQFNLGETKV